MNSIKCASGVCSTFFGGEAITEASVRYGNIFPLYQSCVGWRWRVGQNWVLKPGNGGTNHCLLPLCWFAERLQLLTTKKNGSCNLHLWLRHTSHPMGFQILLTRKRMMLVWPYKRGFCPLAIHSFSKPDKTPTPRPL